MFVILTFSTSDSVEPSLRFVDAQFDSYEERVIVERVVGGVLSEISAAWSNGEGNLSKVYYNGELIAKIAR